MFCREIGVIVYVLTRQIRKEDPSTVADDNFHFMTAFSLVRQLIRKNPFQFQLMEVVVNDSVTREAISRAQERKFLQFVKEDPHFCRYYEGIYIVSAD